MGLRRVRGPRAMFILGGLVTVASGRCPAIWPRPTRSWPGGCRPSWPRRILVVLPRSGDRSGMTAINRGFFVSAVLGGHCSAFLLRSLRTSAIAGAAP